MRLKNFSKTEEKRIILRAVTKPEFESRTNLKI